MIKTVLLSLFLFIGSLEANVQVIFMKGKAKYKLEKEASWFNLSKSSSLFSGTTIQTGPKGIVRLKYQEKLVMVGPSSEIKLVFSTGAENKNVINMVRGFIWNKVNKQTVKESFEVKTPNAALGVRGTQFAVMHSHEGSVSCVCEGQISATRDGIVNSIKRGQGLENSSDGKNTPKDYRNLMVHGKPTSAFNDLVQKDERYKQCLYCHNSNFDVDNFKWPTYYDYLDMDYD